MRFTALLALGACLWSLVPGCANRRSRDPRGPVSTADAGTPDAGAGADAAPVADAGGYPPSCFDGMRSGDESQTDCGGSCPRCPDGALCRTADDCESGVCGGGFCLIPTCDDGVQNGDERDVDCGGGTCAGCAGGSPCEAPEDCLSMVCEAGACGETSCFDGIVNADETDVDCGGSCPGCGGGLACGVPEDCESLICDSGVCTTASCTDDVQNQDESDVDCGGTACSPCDDLSACALADDCLSRVCEAGTCSIPTCADGVQNQDETDADCGGATCDPCADGDACAVAGDCESGVCAGGLCQAPSCTDGVVNGGETDVDCGGATSCPRCEDFQACADPSDCATGACTMGRCGDTGCMPFGTDTFGYFGCSLSLTPTDLPCPDIRATGTATGLGDDSHQWVPIGFDFDFYGTTRTNVGVQSNGTITFTDAYLTLSNTCLPRTSTPDAFVAVLWDDLDPGESGSEVYYQTLGTAPNRTFVVQWDTERFSTTPMRADVRLVLYEGSNDIHVCYQSTDFGSASYDAGLSATAGIQGSTTDSLELSCNTADLTTGLFVQYVHP